MTRCDLSASRIARVSLLALVAGLAACAVHEGEPIDEPELEEAAQLASVPAGTRFVIPRGLATISDNVVVVSTVSTDPTTGGEQGKACPFEGAKKTQPGDTACGYNNQQQWVCCDATCDYTCNINQHNNMQYWNTDSCTVVESTCAVRAGGPGGGGFDIFQTESAGG